MNHGYSGIACTAIIEAVPWSSRMDKEAKRTEESPEMNPDAHTTSLPARTNIAGRDGPEGRLFGDHVGVTGFPCRLTPTLPTNHKNQSKINGKRHWETGTHFWDGLWFDFFFFLP